MRGPSGAGRLSIAGGCAVALLVAVAAAVDPWGFRPYTTWRWVAVGVAAACGAAATRWRPPRPLLAAWVGLLACLALATAVALDPLVAVVGHPRRHLGLAGWLVCALAFAAGTGLSASDVRRYLGRAAVVAVAITGAGAAADLLGWDPPGGAFANGRVGGLLGQPLYLGAAAVLLTPVAAGVAADRSAPAAWRRAGALAAGAGTVAVLGSQTRGAWVGLAVATAVAGPAAWRSTRVRAWVGEHRPAALAGVAVVAVVAPLAVAGPLGSRAVAGLDPETSSARGRLDEWAVAAAVVADHPLTGVGPEGYRVAAPEHVDDAYARRYGRDEVVDRAHNGPLDVAATAGVPAGVLYVALLAAVVVRCVRALRAPPDPVVAGAAAGVVAWVVQQAVGFPIAEVDPAAWLLAGAVVVAGGVLGADAARHGPDPPRERVWSRLRVGAAGGLACLLAAAGVVAVAADRDLRRAERASAASADAAALAAADRATGRRPDDVDAWYVSARVAAARPGLLGIDAGLDRVERGLDRSPRDPALRSLREALLVERALRSGLPDDLRVAQAAAEALVDDDPAHPAHHRHLGLVLAARGRDGRAAGALRRALDLDPDDAVARRALDGLDSGTARPPGSAP